MKLKKIMNKTNNNEIHIIIESMHFAEQCYCNLNFKKHSYIFI